LEKSVDEKPEDPQRDAPALNRPWQDSRVMAVGIDLLRYIMLVPVIATLLVGLSLVVYGAIETGRFVEILFLADHEADRNEVLLLAIEILDLFLLATVVELVALGIYQLHFNPDLRLPKWLKVESLDDMKSKLVSVTITVLAVYFLGRAVVSSGGPDILYLGAGSAVVIAALTYFLSRIDK
jgi:uncharacterized membrane protein YqhA